MEYLNILNQCESSKNERKKKEKGRRIKAIENL
jgi:hypothetical protein